ncbi:uncharacterized protein A1O9_04443 [Exophiala aquamarina CBS 119918]|uniref:Xylanolytic transcriptional activator regulatory domain-containing protein n=1 Tax=Exophiala aquamarina CBS 119918 TaxID=1182545 RepID=A0A072PIL7_9EURO|nr:uncharacterized protein A1O9_04443 [Exophiala aquamarina CBS 119918]KEF59597.1 hypothetical protein A1O9_04443 [Exophiala aquamarina CBS 119918]
MCSGAAHVHIDSLQALGYDTRKSARRAFFERARVLYDFDCEPDRVSLVQAFLLMTYWYDASIRGRHKDRKFWIRESVTLAQDLGLDLELENCTSKRQRLLKRIWWCCFMRDQFVALMTWTPPQFRAGYRSMPMLGLEDFEIKGYSEIVSRDFSGWAFIDSDRIRIELAMLCIEKARLCLCIDRILQVRYTSLRHESATQTLTILVPKRNNSEIFEVIEHDHQLQGWYQGLSDSGNFDLRDPVSFQRDEASNMITTHRAHLKLLFLSALIALHRPQVLDGSGVVPSPYQQLSRAKLREAADEVGHLAMCMTKLQMGTHIRPKGVTLFLPILLVHLQDIAPEMVNRQGNRLSKYHHCMQILDSIGDQNIPEDLLPLELEAAFRKLNILPSQDTTIPLAIPHLMQYHNQSSLERGLPPYLSHLGTITSAEINLLTELCHPTTDIAPFIVSHEDESEVDIDFLDLTK